MRKNERKFGMRNLGMRNFEFAKMNAQIWDAQTPHAQVLMRSFGHAF